MNDSGIDADKRKAFLKSYHDDVDQFLNATETDSGDVGTKDIDITTDLGSSATSHMLSIASGLTSPEKLSSPEKPSSPGEIIPEELEDVGDESESQEGDSSTPIFTKSDTTPIETSPEKSISPELLYSDTPMMGKKEPEGLESTTKTTDEVTVHNIDTTTTISDDSLDTDALKKIAGVKSLAESNENISLTATTDAAHDNSEVVNPPENISVSKVDPLIDNNGALGVHELTKRSDVNLIDKVSFMESTVQVNANQNNTLLATGASIAELPAEEEAINNVEELEQISNVNEDVQKIINTIKQSEDAYSESNSSELEDEESTEERPGSSSLRGKQEGHGHTSNIFESTPIRDEYLGDELGFDLSPVKQPEADSDGSSEKDMAYYLAKIKEKQVKKSLEIRSSMDSGPTAGSISKSKSEDEPTFAKPKFLKKKTGIKKPATSIRSSGSILTKASFKRSIKKLDIESPVAAYIKSKKSVTAKRQWVPKASSKTGNEPLALSTSKLGDTWTNRQTDRSLIEVIHADGDVHAWKELHRRTKDELEDLQNQVLEMESRHKETLSQMELRHETDVEQYKEQVFVLQVKLKQNGQVDGQEPGGPDAKLVKQITELETLLSGYETENKKLYEEAKQARSVLKEDQTRMYLENKELAAANATLKSVLEQRDATIRQLQHKYDSLARDRGVSALQQLAAVQLELDESRKCEVVLRNRVAMLEEELGSGSRAAPDSIIDFDKQISRLVREHAVEREELYKKMESLSKEQAHKVDKDLLARRDDRINELLETVRRLQSPEYAKEITESATTEYKSVVSDLQRQVRELERALHKRHPDSISALIAATNTPGYSDRITEMQQNLDRVIADYENHFQKLQTERVPMSELNEQREINLTLQRKVNELNQLLADRDKKIGNLIRSSGDFDVLKARANMERVASEYEDLFDELRSDKVNNAELESQQDTVKTLRNKISDLKDQLSDKDQRICDLLSSVSNHSMSQTPDKLQKIEYETNLTKVERSDNCSQNLKLQLEKVICDTDLALKKKDKKIDHLIKKHRRKEVRARARCELLKGKEQQLEAIKVDIKERDKKIHVLTSAVEKTALDSREILAKTKNEFKQCLNNLNAEKITLKQTNERLQDQKTEYERQLKILNNDNLCKNKKIIELEKFVLHSREKLESEKLSYNNSLNDLKAENENLRKKAKDLNEKVLRKNDKISELVSLSQDFNLKKTHARLEELRKDYEDHFKYLSTQKVDREDYAQEKRKNDQLRERMTNLSEQMMQKDRTICKLLSASKELEGRVQREAILLESVNKEKKRNSELKQKLEQLNEDLMQKNKEIRQLASDCDETARKSRRNIDKLRSEYEEKLAAVENGKVDREELEKEQQRNSELRGGISELSDEVLDKETRIHELLSEAKDDAAQARKVISKIQREYASYRKKVEVEKVDRYTFDAEQKRNAMLRDSISQLKDDLQKREKKIRTLTEDALSAANLSRHKFENLKTEYDKYVLKVKEEKVDLAELKKEKDDNLLLRDNISDLKNEICNRDEKIEELLAVAREHGMKLRGEANRNLELENVSSDNKELRGRLANLNDLVRQRDSTITNLQRTIKELKSPQYEQDLIDSATTKLKRIVTDLRHHVSVLEAALNKRHPDIMGELLTSADVVRRAELEGELELKSVQAVNANLRDRVSCLQAEALEYETRIRDLERERLVSPYLGGGITGLGGELDRLSIQLKAKEREITQLRSKLTLSSTNRKSQEFKENRQISELRKELSVLRTKCDLLKIENDQQRANLTGMRVEHEATLNKLREAENNKLEEVIESFKDEKKKLIAQHAAKFAKSDMGRLRAKIDTLEMQLAHYTDVARSVPDLEAKLKAMRVKESNLADEVVRLGKELDYASSQQSPSLHEYRTIQNKVHNLELTHKTQVDSLRTRIGELEAEKVKVVLADEFVAKKYQEQLLEKNLQIERFQNEIDAIMNLCMELQANGIILPAR